MMFQFIKVFFVCFLFSFSSFADLVQQESIYTSKETVADSKFQGSLMLGTQRFSGEKSEILGGGFAPGMTVGYRVTDSVLVQASYTRSNNDFNVRSTDTSAGVEGDISYLNLGLQGKVYLPSVKSISPYLVGGLSRSFRTFRLNDVATLGKDSATSFDAGVGFELPFLSNRYFAGLQALYRFVNYPGQNSTIVDSNGQPTGARLKGDEWNVFFTFGVNL